MKRLTLFTRIFACLLCLIWLFSPPIIGIIAEKQIKAHLPAISQQLTQQGIRLELLQYQRAWWQSQTQWKLSHYGQTLSHINIAIHHGIFSSAGTNIFRLQALNTMQAEDLWQEPYQLSLRLSPTAKLITTLNHQQQPISAQAQYCLWQNDRLSLQAENRAHHTALPPFIFSAQLHFPPSQHQQQQRLTPLILFILHHNIELQAQLTLYPQQAQAQIHATLNLQEHINNALQLIALRQRETLITLFERSQLTIEIPNTHTNPQAILDFLARSPLQLQGKFVPYGEQLQSAWHIAQGKLQALNP